jgi:hypothetical protein
VRRLRAPLDLVLYVHYDSKMKMVSLPPRGHTVGISLTAPGGSGAAPPHSSA